MYMDITGTTCYRDAITSLVVLATRNGTDYLVTPIFSTFRNNYLRTNLESIFNFNWAVKSVDTQYNSTDRLNFYNVIEPQAKNSQIVLKENQIAQNPGSYRLTLTMSDKYGY